MEINKLNFEQFKSDRIVNPFEDLDVNEDGKIDSADKTAANDINIFNQISYLLNFVDEDEEYSELLDDTDELAQKADSKDCSDGSCEATLPTSSAKDCSDGSCEVTQPTGSTNDCPDGNCSVSVPSSSNNRVNNADGTYTETKTNANGATVAITYDATGKKVSAKTTNKDGSVVNSTYKYNDDGTYTLTAVYSDKTRVTKYNKEGKRVSYTETYKNGTKKTATFKYNSDGSYSVTIKNKKKGTVCTQKFNTKGKITSSVSKNKKGKTTRKKTYKYNTDGSYTLTDKNYSNHGKVKITNYDANGNKVNGKSASAKVETATASNYKDKLNKNGITFVIFTGPNCGHCDSFHKIFNKNKNVLSAACSLANFVEINSKADGDQLLLNLEDKLNKYLNQYPIIIKFVNGVPTASFHPEEDKPAVLLDQIEKQCKSSK